MTPAAVVAAGLWLAAALPVAVWSTDVWISGLLGGATTAFMMPVLVVGLVWLTARGVPAALARVEVDVAAQHPIALAALGLGLHLTGGVLAGAHRDALMLSGIGLPLLLYAGLSYAAGPATASRYRFALGCLYFALPWEHFLADFDASLQRWSAVIAYETLHLAGYPVTWWDEITIVDPDYWVVVNETCSGMNMLLTLGIYTLVYGWVTQRVFVHRLVLLLLVPGLALLANGLRVAVILLLGKYGGDALAQGFWHTGSAYLLFVPVFWALYAAGRLLAARAAASSSPSAGQSAQSP
ncbi:MAG: exosortase/archaeosortase family protein [Bradymonadia bacterium]